MPSQVIDADAIDELHGDHARGGEGVDRVGNMGRGVVGELALAPLHGPALDGEVKLSLEAALEFPGQRQRFVRGQEGEPALGELGQVLEDVEIGLDDLGDVRAADLQRDGAAIAEDRPVNLGDRRRGHRDGIEREEDLFERPAVVLGEDLLDLAEGERPDVIAQRGQFDGVSFGDDIGPGAQDLAQFHERRPQILADQLQSAGAILRGRVAPHRHALDRPDDSFQVKGGHHVVVAVTNQRGQDLPVAGKIAQMADGFSQQGITAFDEGSGDTVSSRASDEAASSLAYWFRGRDAAGPRVSLVFLTSCSDGDGSRSLRLAFSIEFG